MQLYKYKVTVRGVFNEVETGYLNIIIKGSNNIGSEI